MNEGILRTAIVTGAYGAIGKAISRGLAGHGYRVVMVGRNPEALDAAVRQIIRETGNTETTREAVDLGLKREISAFAGRWKGPLHLLVNNAATAPRRREVTDEGLEVQWAVNVLAYVRLTNAFVPFMKGCDDPRIVNVASYWAGGLNPGDPEFKQRKYDNDAAYRQAKQANRMLSAAYADRLNEYGITVNACHPGDVNSKLSNFFGFGGSESPEEGAATPLYLALSADMAGKTGGYYEHLRLTECPFSRDRDAVEKLFALVSRDYA